MYDINQSQMRKTFACKPIILTIAALFASSAFAKTVAIPAEWVRY